MSGAVLWAGEPGIFEESGGVFVLTLQSGDETFRFAMPPSAARRVCEVGGRAVNNWERDEAERRAVVAFPDGRGKPGKRKEGTE